MIFRPLLFRSYVKIELQQLLSELLPLNCELYLDTQRCCSVTGPPRRSQSVLG